MTILLRKIIQFFSALVQFSGKIIQFFNASKIAQFSTKMIKFKEIKSLHDKIVQFCGSKEPQILRIENFVAGCH